MAASRKRRVSTPIPRRMKLVRERVMPAVVWCMAIAAVAVLYQRQSLHIDAVGLVESHEVVVATLEDGTLDGLGVELYETVNSGDVIGILDGALIEAELQVAMAELNLIRADLEVGRVTVEQTLVDREQNELSDYRRFLVNTESARLDLLEKTVEQAVNRVKLERLGIVQDRQRRLTEASIIDQLTYDETRLRYEGLAKEIEETEPTLAFMRQRVQQMETRATEYGDFQIDNELAILLQPLQEGIAVQQAQIQFVETRKAQNVLIAPISGVVSKIFRRPGDVILAGAPVLTISNPRAETVVAFLDESSQIDIAIGADVQIRSRKGARPTYAASVVRVGQTIEELPIHLRRSQGIVEWGLPIIVSSLPEGAFMPGEIVDLRLRIP